MLKPNPSLKPPSLADRLAFMGLLTVLVWAPLPLGSNRPWAIALLVIALWLLLLLMTAALFWDGQTLGSRLGSAKLPLALLMGYALLLVLQMLPLPVGLLVLLVPGAHEAGSISVAPYHTRQYLLATLVCVAAFTLVVLLVRDARRVRILAIVLVASGVLQAALAILLYSTRAEYQFLYMPFSAGERASGTFANWDHLAGYMEMCLSIGVGLMLSQMSSQLKPPKNGRERVLVLLQFLMSGKMLVRLLLVVMVIALVLSRSRMGNISFFVALLITGCLAALVSTRLRRMALWLVVSLVLVDVLVIGQWVGIDKVMQRIQGTAVTRTQHFSEETVEDRVQAARYALGMVAERPLLGFGGGGFYTAFPRFKGALSPWFFDHTHNDYVEITADTGLAGLALLAALVLLTGRRLLRQMADDQASQTRGMAVGILMAVCCLIFHSFFDFNLQIPANALTFTVILAMSWVLMERASALKTRASPASPAEKIQQQNTFQINPNTE